ncbi:30S ribosomal protein S21 [Candidatus Woesebacteria bacterium]|nr:30S ribosomal protein S21 [Candidatus Woesebacteria bacterium]
MVVVIKKKGESEDKLIARFRKIVLEEGIIDEVRDRERYKKPSERRKEKNKQIKFRIELEKKRNQ